MRRFGRLAVVAVLSVSCTSAEPSPPPGAGPAVRPHRVLRLLEPDSLYLARPSAMLRGTHGETYVSDIVANRVVMYGGDGRPLLVFGRPGGGPGEFRQAASMFLRDDSTLAVLDLSRGAYQLFDLEAGSFRGSLAGVGVGWSVAYQDSVTWLGDMNLFRKTSVAALRAGADTFEYLIPLPPEYLRTRTLAGTYAGVHVVAWRDTLLVGMTGSDLLRIFTTDGRPVDSVRVPVRTRRGVPPDIEHVLTRPGRGHPEWVRAASMLVGLFRKSDGELVLVHADLTVVGPTTSADLYVTTLASDRQNACVDSRLPVSHDAAPMLTFRADTLYVLDREIVSDSAVETRITAYGVDGSACERVLVR
jgi:hypothetical protein